MIKVFDGDVKDGEESENVCDSDEGIGEREINRKKKRNVERD